MNSDDALFTWMRYYASCLLLFIVLGSLGGVLFVMLSPERVAASTVVVQRGESITTRQLGPVAETVFRSEAVSGSVAEQLHLPRASAPLDGWAEIIPVPDAPTIIVLGRAARRSDANLISKTTATALVDALNQQVDGEEFLVFSGPQPSFLPHGLSPAVAVLVGAIAGFWLGLSYAVFHYRWKRPVLTLARALALSGAAQLAIVDRRGWSWLGYLRDQFAGRGVAANEIRLSWLAQSQAAVGVLGGDRKAEVLPTATMTESARVVEDPESRPEAGMGATARDTLVIVARPGTEEREILRSRLALGESDRRDRLGLVWTR